MLHVVLDSSFAFGNKLSGDRLPFDGLLALVSIGSSIDPSEYHLMGCSL